LDWIKVNLITKICDRYSWYQSKGLGMRSRAEIQGLKKYRHKNVT